MPILVNGYNLLNAAGIFSKGKGPASLERSRGALLNFLAATIPTEEVSRTTVVFDAKDAPPGLPREFSHQGIRVLFASRFCEADDLIEELIQADNSPRQLVVVSSDHRIQRTANRRKATAIDSEKWYSELIRQNRTIDALEQSIEVKPQAPLSPDEVDRWLKKFGDVNVEKSLSSKEKSTIKDLGGASNGEDEGNKPGKSSLPQMDNPFPPGYAEDLLGDGD